MIRKLALSVLFLTAIAASPFVAPVSAIAQAGHDQQVLIDKAARVVAPMRADPNFTYSGKLLARAKAVMIVPELTKGGFILGGQGGAAVLVAKRPDGSWSDPAFYSLGGGTLGLQIGVQQAKTVFFIMTDRALDQWMQNQIHFGGQDGIGVFVVGQQNKENALTANLLRRRRHREILRPIAVAAAGLEWRRAQSGRQPPAQRAALETS
jgi:lipid-binding SYLF domain-containing protein